MYSQVFDISNYYLNYFAIPPLIAALFILIISIKRLIDEGINRARVALTFLNITIFIWLFFIFFMYCSNNGRVALWWAKTLNLGVVFIPSALYYFTVVVLKLYDTKKRIVWIGWLLSSISAFIIIGTDIVITGMRSFSWGYYTQYSLWSLPYLLFFVTYIVLSLHLFGKGYSLATSDSLQYRRSKSLLISLFVGSAGLIDYLPNFGIAVPPCGCLGVFAAIIIFNRTVTKYRLVDITPKFAAQSIIDTMSDALLVFDPEGIIRLTNHSAEDLLGIPRKGILDKNISEIIGDAVFRDPGLLIRNGSLSERELSYRNPDRGMLTLSVSLSRMTDDKKKLLAVILMARDISEKKRAEDDLRRSLKEKETLLREIHHRVKNNMAVISSLLRLQSNTVKDAGVRHLFEESQQRIRSMAIVHDKLYQTKDLSSVDFNDYVGTLVKEIASLYHVDTGSVTTEINIEDIELDLESAIPCGLIINELLTNAFKYAFPDGRSGVLSVDFTKTDGTYTLTVRDNGVGLPEGFNYKEAGFLGLQLVNVLAEQLMGTLQLKSEKGTKAVVTFTSKKND